MKITDHVASGLNEAIIIEASNPGPGGAHHTYDIQLKGRDKGGAPFGHLVFQNGPISSPADCNGISNEALLAILIDRMRGFQHNRHLDGTYDLESRGKFSCVENQCALQHMQEALMWLHRRTAARVSRGVEGSLKP